MLIKLNGVSAVKRLFKKYYSLFIDILANYINIEELSIF